MKRICIFALIFALLLSLAACGGNAPSSDIPDPTDSKTRKEPADALSRLRADMKPPVIAVANFYFPELSEDFGIMDYLLDEYPGWMEENDFIRNMPEERIVRTCGYDDMPNLVCLVPYDPESRVSVRVVRWLDGELDKQEDIVYSSEKGDPIMLLVDTSENVTVTVEVINSEGRGVTWYPYWESSQPIPDDGYYGHLVMDFTPESEKTVYERYVDDGWFVPDIDVLAGGLWQSDCGYSLELFHNPGEVFDGTTWLSAVNYNGESTLEYSGYWSLIDGKLRLELYRVGESTPAIQGDFPVLADPWDSGWLAIGCSADGTGLPHFYEGQEFDELWPVDSAVENPYEFALSQGWYMPELWELEDSFWLSGNRYGLELMDDSVPGDNGGSARLYDVDEIGAYTLSYSGSWRYEEGMLYLSLVPKFEDGYLVDDSFPVLMLDGELWIGRNSSGLGLPYFGSDTLADVLDQPKG